MKHNFKKNLGQNFLRNDKILKDICDSFEVLNNGNIIEIGPGDGALTKLLVSKNIPVTSFEVDDSLKEYLDKINSDNLTIIYKDFLSINLKDYIDNKNPLYVVSNVPYYITTPIITKFINENIIPDVMVLMVQKEVGKRLSSKPGNSEYGAISVILNYFFDILYLFDVGKDNFYPKPNVDSAVIKFIKKQELLKLNDFNIFKNFVNDAFKHKRKNLKNNLGKYDLIKIESILKKYSFDLSNRAEDLSYEIFVDIVNNL